VTVFVREGARIRCVVCGSIGYDVDGPKSWKNAHLRGHAPCPRCGKPLSLRQDGKPRTHGTCPRGKPS